MPSNVRLRIAARNGVSLCASKRKADEIAPSCPDSIVLTSSHERHTVGNPAVMALSFPPCDGGHLCSVDPAVAIKSDSRVKSRPMTSALSSYRTLASPGTSSSLVPPATLNLASLRRGCGALGKVPPSSHANCTMSARAASMSAEELREMLLLQHKLESASTVISSHSIDTEDPMGCDTPASLALTATDPLREEMTYFMTKRLRYSNTRSSSTDVAAGRRWLSSTLGPAPRDTRKRKRAVARLDRRQILECLTCRRIEIGGYKFGDYVVCSNCGNNDFVSVREWSPSRDGCGLRPSGYPSSDGE
ncbi:hypothetical protein IE077_000410 [Cardiosporidium cionae]|uniref:Uncharacterized protein n=1 Tax=Cardiosporidium cionae TaxID=476202 RepID=A0ABQ7J9Y9_9APIC|nr:hypothetical protein IE077_000410 [Cardiosporidium cionae]|eukprot:KAF8820805.1 hypothetical protein IE077_000410 [Cardiosporidium cionae]